MFLVGVLYKIDCENISTQQKTGSRDQCPRRVQIFFRPFSVLAESVVAADADALHKIC